MLDRPLLKGRYMYKVVSILSNTSMTVMKLKGICFDLDASIALSEHTENVAPEFVDILRACDVAELDKATFQCRVTGNHPLVLFVIVVFMPVKVYNL